MVKNKNLYILQKIMHRLPVALYLAIYSVYSFDLEKIRPWLRLDNTTLRIMVIFIAYIIAGYLTTIRIKYHKHIKLIYFLNALLFILIMCI